MIAVLTLDGYVTTFLYIVCFVVFVWFLWCLFVDGITFPVDYVGICS